MEQDLQVKEGLPAATAGEPTPPTEAELEQIAAPATVQQEKKSGYWNDQWKRIKKYHKLLWFLLPAALITLIFSYLPMLGVLFAFKGSEFNLTKGDVMWNLTHGSWTLMNFAEIFVDNSFWDAVGNTLVINIIRLIFCFPLSIFIAVQLSELKSQTLSKVILIIISIPNFLSWAIVIGIWSGMLDPDIGVLGRFVGHIMAKDGWFKALAVFFSAWKGAGWGCILFYSAIMSIDKSYYESATLEGANRLQKMIYLTIPSILPTIALMLVLNISGMMAAGFEQIYTMMQVNPGVLEDSQIILDTYLYTISIVRAENIPFATALGVFNGLIALILMLVGNKITTKTMKRGLW